MWNIFIGLIPFPGHINSLSTIISILQMKKLELNNMPKGT